MPDISMCSSNTCPLKESCYRFTATPSPFRQSYGGFKYDEVTKECKHYWNDVEYKREIQERIIIKLKKEQEHGKDN